VSIDISSSPPPSAQARLTSGPTEVGRDRLSWKGVLVGEGVGVRVDESEHGGRPLAESSHIKHHHVHQKLTNSVQQNAN